MARGRIEGITIEINGETKLLKDALKDVDQSLRNTQVSLRDVNKLLRFNPSSFSLMGQKQAYLAEQINNTKERLKTLKEAQKQAAEAAKNGNKEAEESYKAITREIIETEKKLKDLEKAFTRGGSASKIAQTFVAAGTALENAGKKVKEFGDKVKGLGREMRPISLFVSGLGAGALKLNKKWDTAFDNMIYKSGKTGEGAQELRDMLKNMYAGSAFELSDISDTIGQVAARFKGLSNKEIEEMTDSLLKFQKITGVDAKKSVDDLGRVMTFFKVPAKDYKKVLDGLVKAQTETGTDINKLLDTMRNYGAPLQKLFGNDIAKSIGVLASLDKYGTNSTKVMMSLQKALTTELKDMPLEKAQQSMMDLFKALKSGAKSVPEMKEALELMGSRGGLALVTAFDNAGLSWEELVGVIEGSGGTVESVFDETYNSEEKNRQKIHEMEVAALDFAEAVSKFATPALGWLTEKINILSDKWNGLSGEQQQAILKIGGIIAIAAPALMILGGVIGSIGTIIGLLGGIFKWVGIILGKGLFLMPGAFGGIKAAAGTVGGALATWLGPILAVLAIGVVIIGLMGKFHKQIDEAIKKVNEFLDKYLRPALDAIGNLLPGKPVEAGKPKGLTGPQTSGADRPGGNYYNDATVTAINKVETAAANHHKNEKTRSGERKTFYEADKKALDVKASTAEKDYGRETNAINKATNKLISGFGLASTSAGVESNKVKTAMSNAKNGMAPAGQAVGNEFGSGITNSKAASDTETLSGKIRNWLKGIGNDAYGWGADAGTQWGKGLNSKKSWLGTITSGIAGVIKSKIGFSVPESGPLSDADTYMPDMIQLFTKGINDNKYKLLNAVSALGKDVKTELGLDPDVTNSLTNNTIIQPVNYFAITIGNKEIKDFTVQAVTSEISNKMRAQNMTRGRL